LWLPYGAILAVGNASHVVSGIAGLAFWLILPVTVCGAHGSRR
jgi:hypothetical protein